MIGKEKAIEFLATGGFIGYIPVVPGTFGSLLGVLPVFFLSSMSAGSALTAIIIFTAVSVTVADRASRHIGAKDPGCIVIDEIVGMMIAFWGIPLHIETLGAGFLLFRLLDGAKPFPIGFLDRNLTGGFGIVADDAAAGILTNLSLRLFMAVS
jgi:phosphatidylglycerophosphatase A